VTKVFTLRRAWIAVFAALAVLFAVMEAGKTAPAAHAESGRRLCRYIDGIETSVKIPKAGSTTDSYTVQAKLWVTVDYKKDHACPTIEDPYQIAGDSSKSVRTNKQPVPEDVCEDWGRAIGQTGPYLGTISSEDSPLALAQGNNPFLVDVCNTMSRDYIYEFYVIDENVGFLDGTRFSKGEFVTNKRYNSRG
jgi:hypothetical protein